MDKTAMTIALISLALAVQTVRVWWNKRCARRLRKLYEQEMAARERVEVVNADLEFKLARRDLATRHDYLMRNDWPEIID